MALGQTRIGATDRATSSAQPASATNRCIQSRAARSRHFGLPGRWLRLIAGARATLPFRGVQVSAACVPGGLEYPLRSLQERASNERFQPGCVGRELGVVVGGRPVECPRRSPYEAVELVVGRCRSRLDDVPPTSLHSSGNTSRRRIAPGIEPDRASRGNLVRKHYSG